MTKFQKFATVLADILLIIVTLGLISWPWMLYWFDNEIGEYTLSFTWLMFIASVLAVGAFTFKLYKSRINFWKSRKDENA